MLVIGKVKSKISKLRSMYREKSSKLKTVPYYEKRKNIRSFRLISNDKEYMINFKSSSNNN